MVGRFFGFEMPHTT